MASKNKKSSNKNLWIVVLVVVALLLFGAIFMQNNSSHKPIQKADMAQSSSEDRLKKYYSKDLKITFDYPGEFQIETKYTDIVLKNEEGEILVSRSGTNVNTLNDYLDNLSKLNNLTVSDRKELTINGYSSVQGMVDNKKYYFIYPANSTVVSISSDSQAHFDDLDQIARSFRYTP